MIDSTLKPGSIRFSVITERATSPAPIIKAHDRASSATTSPEPNRPIRRLEDPRLSSLRTISTPVPEARMAGRAPASRPATTVTVAVKIRTEGSRE
jgi:hypothetical protein